MSRKSKGKHHSRSYPPAIAFLYRLVTRTGEIDCTVLCTYIVWHWRAGRIGYNVRRRTIRAAKTFTL